MSSYNTKIITFTPTWVYIVETANNSLWILFSSSLVLCAIAYVYDILKEKKILCDDKESPLDE